MKRIYVLVLYLACCPGIAAWALPVASSLTLETQITPIGEHAENVDTSGDRFIAGGDDFEALIYKKSNGVWSKEARLGSLVAIARTDGSSR